MHFGRTRRAILGPASLAKNTLRQLCNELAANYTVAPQVRHTSGNDYPEYLGRDGILAKLGVWSLLQQMQVKLIGMREMLLRLDWSEELQAPSVRLVTPDTVLGSSWASAPSVPYEIRELLWRNIEGYGWSWCWDVFSIQDPERPFYRVLRHQADGDGADVTEAAFGKRFEGEAYPYRWTEGVKKGKPFLPFVLYHASQQSALWGDTEGIEVVEGTLDVACAWTYVQHTMNRAGFPQRYVVGARVAGGTPTEGNDGQSREIVTDPTSLLHLEAEQGVTNPQVGQWGAGADPEMLARVTANLESAVANFDGSDNSHIIRSTANPWSEGALAIAREGKRAAQTRYAAFLHRTDLEFLEKLACICNLQAVTTEVLPECGYIIRYSILPLSPEELRERRAHANEMIASGRWSIVDAYMYENPGMTREEAVAELERIKAENKQMGVKAGTQPTPYSIDDEDANAAEPAEPGDDAELTDKPADKPNESGDAKPAEPADKGAGSGDGTTTPPATPAANTALNGAQVEAAKNIVSDVAAGAIPRDTGIAMLVEFFNLNADRAERIMGSVGKTFKPLSTDPTQGK